MSLCLVLVDWENVSKQITEGRYTPERFSRSTAIVKLFEWIKSEVDEIFDTFLFAPLHIVYTDYQLFHDHGLSVTTCPKIPLASPDKKDTVDPTLIKRAEKWVTHPDLTHICLVSGDSDFIPLLEKAKKRGLLIMISAIDSSLLNRPSLSKDLAEMADISPRTGQTMIHYFSPIII